LTSFSIEGTHALLAPGNAGGLAQTLEQVDVHEGLQFVFSRLRGAG
jgi:hypothetical protein